MVRVACPRCQSVLNRPECTGGARFICPCCGQPLRLPVSVAEDSLSAKKPATSSPAVSAAAAGNPGAPPAPVPPLPVYEIVPIEGADPQLSTASSQVPDPPRPRRRERDEGDDMDDDVGSIERYSGRRGRLSSTAAARAATAGLAYALVSLGLLPLTFMLWAWTVQRQRAHGVEGAPLIAIMLLVVLVSFLLALVGTVRSSQGLREENTHQRGRATVGLVCSIISLVIGSVVGLFFLCAGTIFWPVRGGP